MNTELVHDASRTGEADTEPVARAEPVAQCVLDIPDAWAPVAGDDGDPAAPAAADRPDGDLTRRGERNDVPCDLGDCRRDEGQVGVAESGHPGEFPALATRGND